jgi:phenylacetic acid degradation operon negative regulatory protein
MNESTPTAKRMVLEFLTAMPENTATVQQLIAACQVLNISENSLRVAIARLKAEKKLEVEDRGLYSLGENSEAVRDEVTSWRTVDSETVPTWDRTWLAVHTGHLPRQDRKQIRRREQALRFLGFRTLRHGLEVRPNNLVDNRTVIRQHLERLGLDSEALIFVISEAEGLDEPIPQQLWNTEGLNEVYDHLLDELEKTSRAMDGCSTDEAARLSWHLGKRVISQIVLDPLLPEPLVNAHKRTELIQRMLEFDKRGRELWFKVIGLA